MSNLKLLFRTLYLVLSILTFVHVFVLFSRHSLTILYQSTFNLKFNFAFYSLLHKAYQLYNDDHVLPVREKGKKKN